METGALTRRGQIDCQHNRSHPKLCKEGTKGNERQVAGQKGRKVNIRAKETLEDAENQ